MSPQENIPTNIKSTLVELGVERIRDVEKIRESLAEIAGLGTPLLSEFILHNQVHSDNLIRLLGRLNKVCGLRLSGYEAFLLVASAYLHDIGIFFDGNAFEEEILPDPAATLLFCPQGLCDTIENYQLFGLDIGAQIRETHNLLSAYWLYHEVTPIDGITDDDKPYLMTICRGHRKANLRERGCWCYGAAAQDGEAIRVGLLASLLRLVNAMDFHSNRAPASFFRNSAATLLNNPVSLGRWIKHYLVSDPFVAKVDEWGNPILECIVYFSVPMKELNGVSYLDFFGPLFDRYIQEAQNWDFDVNEYPPDLTTALGIYDIRLVLEKRELPGGRDLPKRIMSKIEQTSCRDILAFLEQLARTMGQDSMMGVAEESMRGELVPMILDTPSEPVLIVEDHPWYRKHLDSILTEVGYRCELSGTFEEALKKLSESNPFVLLLDLKLDGEFRKGWDLASAAVDRGIPIIVITSYPSIEGLNRAFREFGVVYFFDKSRLSPEELIQRVHEVASRFRKKRLSRDQRQALLENLLGLFPDSSS